MLAVEVSRAGQRCWSRRTGRHYLDRTVAALKLSETRTFFEDEYRTLSTSPRTDALVRLLLESGATGLVRRGRSS